MEFTQEIASGFAPAEVSGTEAAERLLPLVYDELRRLAARRIGREKPGQTLQATALVHEAYVRLVDGGDPGWRGRGHFFAAAAEAMRRILVDRARRKRSLKAGGLAKRVELGDEPASDEPDPIDLIALDEAIDRLEESQPDKADLVKLRYFAGLSIEETAEILGISRATVVRHWHFARAWLLSEIRGSESIPTDSDFFRDE